ncbi:MAG: prephenate dehydratase [Cenarchaeum symbiont of Oopsacas minuta]|nr:prephenate dehydratase [Cenarchaeum symbiont of Oopsacas minuta]
MTAHVSFQGEHGAYSESAAINFFGKNVQTFPCPTFSNALDAIYGGECEHAMLPIENSIEGNVGESYDLLYETDLKVIGETYQKIDHCLIGTASDMAKVQTIYSHPQALGQCRKFIQSRGIKIVPTYDTAGSVPIVKKLDDSTVACIASEDAAIIHGLPIIARNIANSLDNYTRFLIMGKKETECKGDTKTSIMFTLKHEPGALYNIIGVLSKAGINLTKIASRPRKGMVWEYNFYLDFEDSCQREQNVVALEEICKTCSFLKVLGTYPVIRFG